MVIIDASKGNLRDIKNSSVVNKNSLSHQGLLNHLNVKGDIRKRIYFRYNKDKDLIYYLYENCRLHSHIHIGTRRLSESRRKFLETENKDSLYPVLIKYPKWFFKHEHELARYPSSQ